MNSSQNSTNLRKQNFQKSNINTKIRVNNPIIQTKYNINTINTRK